MQGVLTERSQRACQAEPTAAGSPHDDALALVGSPGRVEQSRKGRLTIPQKVCILRERWHICMHICMHAYIHAYMSAYMRICIHVCMYGWKDACMNASVHTRWMYACFHASACVCVCVRE